MCCYDEAVAFPNKKNNNNNKKMEIFRLDSMSQFQDNAESYDKSLP